MPDEIPPPPRVPAEASPQGVTQGATETANPIGPGDPMSQFISASTPPEVKLAAVRSSMIQHVAALGLIGFFTWLFRADLTFWEPVGAVLLIVGVVQLPAIIGKAPPGSIGMIQLMLWGGSAARAAAVKLHLISLSPEQ